LSNYNVITKDEWKEMVKKSKKRSVLSIFLKRIYSVCKIILESKKMTEMIMRICVNTRNKYQIENDPRISNCNYGSRLNYSTEMAILEK